MKCAANLRSIGQAMTMYVQQSRHYPAAVAAIPGAPQLSAVWPTRLRAYMGGATGAFNCPSRDDGYEWHKSYGAPGGSFASADATRFGYEEGEKLLSYAQTRFSYGYNASGRQDLAHDGGDRLGLGWLAKPRSGTAAAAGTHERPASKIRRAAEMIAVADGTGEREASLETWFDLELRPWPQPPPGGPQLALPGAVHRRGANVLFCDGHVQWYPQAELIDVDLSTPKGRRMSAMWNYDHEP